MLSRIIHAGGELFYTPARNKFMSNLNNVEEVQRGILRDLLKQASNTEWGREQKFSSNWSYEQMREHIPTTEYKFWEEMILKQRKEEKEIISPLTKRYQPTSGTTSARKWIPYTESFLNEMKRGTAPWFVDMYRKYPGARKGKHFWSLSWIPTELRETEKDQDDLSLFPWWQRFFMNYNMAVPGEASFVKTSDDTMTACLAYLCATTDLSVIFIWSPTFFDQILDQIWIRRDELAWILNTGKWSVQGVKAPKDKKIADKLKNWSGGDQFFKELWPGLSLLSCWNSAGSEVWAKDLAARLPYVEVQGKGLFATEGILTIPHEESFLLTYRSHFYEFQCLDTGKVSPAWELEKDQRVKPLLTTGSGLWRYALNDELLVSGFQGKCPQLEFQGRISGVDMVGEKMEAGVATQLLQELERAQKDVAIKGLSLLAIRNPQGGAPYYLGLFEGPPAGPQFVSFLEEKGEKILQKHFHYQVARELRQLASFKVLIDPQAVDKYLQLVQVKGIALGDVKVDPLMPVDSL